MKTIKSVSLLAALAGIVITGCSNEDMLENNHNNALSYNQISIKAYTDNDAQTRMGYEDNGSAVAIKWTEGDAFTIIPAKAGADAQVFTLAEGANTNAGTFNGYAPDVDASGYTVLYPAKLANTAAFDAFSYSGQAQNGNDNTVHLAAFHTIKLAVNSSDVTSINFGDAATVQSSLLVLNLKNLPEGVGTPQSVAIHAEEACLAVTNNTVGTDVSLNLNGFPAITSGNNSIKAYLMLGANGDNAACAEGKKLTVTLVGSDGSYTASFTAPAGGLCFAGGKRNSITASKWEADEVEEEVPYLFDMTKGWTVSSATVDYVDGYVKLTSTAANRYNRCDSNLKGLSLAMSLLGNKVIYYRAKATQGTIITANNAKVSVYIDGKINVDGTEGIVTITQYKGEELGTDQEGYQWYAFDLSKLGTEGHTAEMKFRPDGEDKDTTYKSGSDLYDALIAAAKGMMAVEGATFNRLDFIMISDLADKNKFESFLVKEVGVASLSVVKKKMQE